MPFADEEDKRAYMKKYYKKNKIEIGEYNKEYYENHKKDILKKYKKKKKMINK